MNHNHTLLVTGACRSGKSRYVISRFQNFSGKKFLLATGEALDDEMRQRIEKHRQERDATWTTIEEPVNPVVFFKENPDTANLVVLDCLTLWLSNLLMRETDEETVLKKTDELIAAIQTSSCTAVVVTNEVGWGIVPDNALGRAFRDLSGKINQRFAAVFDEVVMMVSGIALTVKHPPSPPPGIATTTNPNAFPEMEKKGVYDAIYYRRDMRHFLPDPVHPETLGRVLDAAHHAGSVGFMQPWNFIIIDDPSVKQRVYENFKTANERAAQNYSGDKKELYTSMKLQGILDAPLNICITCDSSRMGPNVLGRDTMPETDLFSTSCAVQNLWLSARAEGLAVGWVSILDVEQLKNTLRVPDNLQPVAYLCIGHCDNFYREPMLQNKGWASRLPLEDLVYYNRWEGKPGDFRIALPHKPDEPRQ